MRAVIVREFGPVETAAIGEIPKPVPGANEVLVEFARQPPITSISW